MHTKRHTLGFSAISLIIGLFIGYMIAMPSSSPHDMHSMMNNMTSSLEGKTGNAFDKAFLEEMVTHHEGAVDMARMVLQTSKRPELITLAEDIIQAQEKEISLMKTWLDEWFK